MKEPQLIHSSIQTPDGTILVSQHRHHYVTHKDKNSEKYILDGGIDYIRTSINKEPAKSLALYDDAPFKQIREVVTRGGRGVNGDEELKYVVLKDINDEWLDAIIIYEEKYRPENRFIKFYKMEKEWRQ